MPSKDFTKKREEIFFTIDDDRFDAVSALPAQEFKDFLKIFNMAQDQMDTEQALAGMDRVFEMVLTPESLAVFSARQKSKESPVDFEQLSSIALWLVEQYGGRPTELPVPSGNGLSSQASGMNSMDSGPQPGSIPATFLPTGS